MNSYKSRAIEDVVCAELGALTKEEVEFITFTDDTTEHYNYEKLTAEGSIWIVYVMDVINDYYKQNKKRIDEIVNKIINE